MSREGWAKPVQAVELSSTPNKAEKAPKTITARNSAADRENRLVTSRLSLYFQFIQEPPSL